jgi:hypothetical protein
MTFLFKWLEKNGVTSLEGSQISPGRPSDGRSVKKKKDRNRSEKHAIFNVKLSGTKSDNRALRV